MTKSTVKYTPILPVSTRDSLLLQTVNYSARFPTSVHAAHESDESEKEKSEKVFRFSKFSTRDPFFSRRLRQQKFAQINWRQSDKKCH